MAKKKTNAKSRIELKFDSELHAELKQLAEDTGVSVNQLMKGVALWMVKHGRPGEAIREDDGFVRVKEQPGCVYFGDAGRRVMTNEWDDENTIARFGQPSDYMGELYFCLDFTERRVIREDD